MLNLDWRFFPVFEPLDPATAYPGSYDFALVATSLLIAILAAFVALSISGRIVATASQRGRIAWATAGAIAMGGGIWSMHFIGMLAFSLPCGIAYDPAGTVLSMIPGVIASGIALATISQPTEPNLRRLAISAVLMGAGIGAMHYAGMAAMRPEALLRYDPILVLLSIVVAVVLAFISLSIRFRFRRADATRLPASGLHSPLLHSTGLPATLIAATVMGCAVAGMHYTAMSASIFFPLPNAPASTMALSPTLLALLIAVFTVLIAASTLVATFAGRQNELAISLAAEVERRRLIEADLVRAREQAEAANLAKSQFLATMSHEIRTPMNGVLGMANLLSSTPLNERQRRLIENLMRSGQALLATINDVLDFSKIEAGHVDLFEVDFDPREVIAEITDLFCEPCARKGLEFVYYIADDVPAQLRGDPVKVRQVLINLVGNAIKYTDRGEVLLEVALTEAPVESAPVESSSEQVRLSFTVEDTGVGIPAEQVPHVFESFYQAAHATSRARGGSGLGLTIAKHLVELMHGEIGVESELGRGSRFHFTVALKRPARPVAGERAGRHVSQTGTQSLRVLLVDSNAASARVMALYLSSWRFDATVVATVGEAESAWTAAAAAGRAFGVVIIDIKGLGAAGVAFAGKVRAPAPGPAGPGPTGPGPTADVIALVGIDSFGADDTVEQLGAIAVLTKPPRPSELYDCLVTLAAGGPAITIAPTFARRAARASRPQFEARVLLAEDNAVNREVAVGMLEAMGCRVVTTLHGRDAVERFARERFDLVLMDCEMPVMDGFEASRRIRDIEVRVVAAKAPGEAVAPARAPPARTPIVAVTAHALTTVQDKCLQSGMDDFLVKPFDEMQLAQAIRRWLPGRERTPAEIAPAPAIDPATIDRIRALRGDDELLRRVIGQFLDTAPGMVAEMRARTEAGDAEAVWRAAHSLKSSAAAIGARTLSERCAVIETAARRQGDLPDGAALDAVDAALAAASQSLTELT